jgi:hypothetical protein
MDAKLLSRDEAVLIGRVFLWGFGTLMAACFAWAAADLQAAMAHLPMCLFGQGPAPGLLNLAGHCPYCWVALVSFASALALGRAGASGRSA